MRSFWPWFLGPETKQRGMATSSIHVGVGAKEHDDPLIPYHWVGRPRSQWK